jgi:hypothetical protein
MFQDYQENLPDRLAETISVVLPLIIKRAIEVIILETRNGKKTRSNPTPTSNKISENVEF